MSFKCHGNKTFVTAAKHRVFLEVIVFKSRLDLAMQQLTLDFAICLRCPPFLNRHWILPKITWLSKSTLTCDEAKLRDSTVPLITVDIHLTQNRRVQKRHHTDSDCNVAVCTRGMSSARISVQHITSSCVEEPVCTYKVCVQMYVSSLLLYAPSSIVIFHCDVNLFIDTDK